MRALSVGVSSLSPDTVPVTFTSRLQESQAALFSLAREARAAIRENSSQTGCYTCIDEGRVYCVVATVHSVFFSFCFFFLVSAWQLQRSGWEGRSTSAKFMPQRCWPAPTLPRNTFLYVPSYVPSPSSWAKESENHSKHQYIIVDVKGKNASFPKTCPYANCVLTNLRSGGPSSQVFGTRASACLVGGIG